MITLLSIYKKMVLRPSGMFRDITREKERYYAVVYVMFFLSCLVPFAKSFTKEGSTIDFFSNEYINMLLSFCSVPQIQWVIIVLGFWFFLSLVKFLCRRLFKTCDVSSLTLCILSISCMGILLQLSFIVFSLFFSYKTIYILWWIAFAWIAFLSVVAIKNSQKNSSYIKSTVIYIVAGMPVVLVTGLMGVAPFLLWMK